uniref:ATP synthase F0 subunit 8 n=1 Tax=Pitambara triremiprocta TaxID=3081123 RepID=UPI002A82858E|nr:ATP synthase F0 subunit 8 [Pitambara triremiprocta]WOW99116.1 ATP synthase F0 subunit 8 [Pitambara triremiprocta]
MPQTSPIMWSMLLILSVMLIIQMNSMIMFDTEKKKKKKKKNKLNKINWKW